MDDDEFAKVVQYFKGLGIDVESFIDTKFWLEIRNGEIVGHEFIYDDDTLSKFINPTNPAPSKTLH